MKVMLKIILAILLLIGLGFWYEHSAANEAFVWEEAPQLFQVEKAKHCDIVYTSASSNFSPRPLEESKLKISQFLNELIPKLQVEAFNIPASGAKEHFLLLKRIPKKSSVKTIVASMNLRSFGADWRHSELETALNKSNVLYEDRPALVNRFLVSLNAYDNATEDERRLRMQAEWHEETLPYDAPQNTVRNWCAVEKWGDWTNPKRGLADQYIKQYAFVVQEENPRVVQFDNMVKLCQERGWKLIFHILPENIETADSLVGKDLTELIYQNANWLEKRYSDKGVTIINNVDLLPETQFSDKDFPTEHYLEEGRRKIAQSISEKINL